MWIKIRLPLALRLVLYAVLGFLFVSGAVWAYFNYLTAASGETAGQWKSWSLQVHGGAAMATLLLIGMLLSTHSRFAWRARRNRINGIVLLTVLGILILTGYFLYYAGNESLRAWSSWIHIGVGFLLPASLLLHVIAGRRSRG
jgi:hypothetical protein